MEGYCVKCKIKVEIKNSTNKTSKNGRKMICGICGTCGTKVNRFVSG